MLLKSRSLPYEEIKIDDEAERLAFYAKCGPSVRQMPQIFINDQRVGGLAGLQAALAQIGQKTPALEAIAANAATGTAQR